MQDQKCQVVGFRTPSKKKFIPRPLSVKLGDLIRHQESLRRPIDEALTKKDTKPAQ